MKWIPKILTILTAGLLLVEKILNPSSSTWGEVVTDVVLVLLMLGLGELIFSYILAFVLSFYERLSRHVKTKNIMQLSGYFKQFLLAICLLIAGVMSPSNGLDEGFQRDPFQMIMETLAIIGIAVLVYLWIRKRSSYNQAVMQEVRQD